MNLARLDSLQDQHGTLRVYVTNTFLHVKDTDTESCKLSRSASDSSLYSRSLDEEWPCTAWDESRRAIRNSQQDRQESTSTTTNSLSSGDLPQAASPPGGCSIDGRETPVPEERKASWSIGAENHDLGRCSPCAWNWKPTGCINSFGCAFCHLCPASALKERRKSRVVQLKKYRDPALPPRPQDPSRPCAPGQLQTNNKPEAVSWKTSL